MRARSLGVLLVASIGAAHAETPGEVFSAGRALGAGGAPALGREIESGASAAGVPQYSAAQPQSNFFAGGSGLLVPPGAAKVSGCQVNPADPDARKQQQCDATNFLAKKSTAASFTIAPNDPLLAKARPITGDPASILGTMNGTYSACTPQQVSAPARKQLETCTESRTPAPVTCQKILAVQVTPSPTCVAGTWAYVYGPNTIAGVYCDPGQTAAMLVGVYAYGAPEWQGQCAGNGWRYTYAPRSVSATQLVGTLFPHWWSFCNTVPASVVAGSGCANGTCTYTFTFEAAYATYWLSVSLPPPNPDYTVTDTWDNQCASLEARLP